MSSIFRTSGTDEVYRAIQGKVNPRCQEAHDLVESLWHRVKKYLDPDIAIELPNQFHARFWEIYLAVALMEAGLNLEPSDSRDGPDICIQTDQSRVWVEAVTVSSGQGEDAVPEIEFGVVREVPDNQIKLRLLSAFSEKCRKYRKYVDKQWVDVQEPYVIAINSAQIPSASDCWPPRILRTLLPIGFEILHLEGESLQVTSRVHGYQGEIIKKSGARVETTSFLQNENSGISAVIYSRADVFNHPSEMSKALLLFHNPLAANPLPLGFLKKGHEYWLQNGRLISKNWNQAQSLE